LHIVSSKSILQSPGLTPDVKEQLRIENESGIKFIPPGQSPVRDDSEPDPDRVFDVAGRMDKLSHLSVVSYRMSGLPGSVVRVKNINKLYLWSNGLETLNPEITRLKELRELSLWNNRLRTLPLEIRNLKRLRLLDLRRNKIPIEEQEKIKRLLPQCEIIF
ncbi:MAG: hypothetical protein OEZ36_04385, partial [Spirochaetota bacterium]|nr:hypothetical protein [Spirochaetota bacterium]